MKIFLSLFRSDLSNFVRDNFKILVISIACILLLQYFEKGNSILNITILVLHIIGDVFMVISFKKYSDNEKKPATIYLSIANFIFVIVGSTAVLQSFDGKNWQYFLGTFPFFIATLYQIYDAWDIKGRERFNYKVTTFAVIILALIYYKFELVYNHSWLFIFGYSMLPIFIGMEDIPKVYILRVMSVFIMILGVTIDIFVQLKTQDIIPSATLSSFFITLIAFFGFAGNASKYIKDTSKDQKIIIKGLNLLIQLKKVT